MSLSERRQLAEKEYEVSEIVKTALKEARIKSILKEQERLKESRIQQRISELNKERLDNITKKGQTITSPSPETVKQIVERATNEVSTEIERETKEKLRGN